MKKNLVNIIVFVSAMIASCNSNTSDETGEFDNVETITPVTLTHPSIADMQETVEVNAVSAYLLKTFVKASANGYLQSTNIHLGELVSKGQTLFVIKTKEAEALGNTIKNIDSSLNFTGTIAAKAPGSGYVSQMNFTSGNYVQDGDQLAEITDAKSFVFILDLPYELKQYMAFNQVLQLHLPDSTTLEARVQSSLPVVDSVVQTQRYILHINTTKVIPENLIAKVSIIKKEKTNTITLPKPAILSNEEQTKFWIMQLINDSTAVKVSVQKGIEENNKIEVLSPPLFETEDILLTGNYGLEDTAKVKIVNSE